MGLPANVYILIPRDTRLQHYEHAANRFVIVALVAVIVGRKRTLVIPFRVLRLYLLKYICIYIHIYIYIYLYTRFMYMYVYVSLALYHSLSLAVNQSVCLSLAFSLSPFLCLPFSLSLFLCLSVRLSLSLLRPVRFKSQ